MNIARVEASRAAAVQGAQIELSTSIQVTLEKTQQLVKVQTDLIAAQAELDQKTKDLASATAMTEKAKRDAQIDIDAARKKVADLTTEYTDANNKLEATKLEHHDVIEKLKEARRDLDAVQKKQEELANLGQGQIEELLEVKVGSKEGGSIAHANGDTVVELADAEETCRIEVKKKDGFPASIGKMVDLGVTRFELVDSQGVPLPTADDMLSPNAPSFAANRSDLCDRIRGRLNNKDVLYLRVHFLGAKQAPLEARYAMTYIKPVVQLALGVGFYFAGGDLRHLTDRAQFSAFPALSFGPKFNLPIGDENRDFYLGINAIVGLGFVVGSSERSGVSTSTSPPTPSIKRFTGFLGSSLVIGKYLEIGYAYDIANQAHLLLLTPKLLTSSFLTI